MVNDLDALKQVTAAKEKTITELNDKIAAQDVDIAAKKTEIDGQKTDKTGKETELQGKL